MTYPVIFIHYGNQEWFQYPLLQTKACNSDVIVIGDQENNRYPFVKHYNFDDYYDSAAEFKKVFKHLSKREFKYESFCFERWFILESFMRKHNLQQCFYQDSDNMLYMNAGDFNKEHYFDVQFACFIGTGHMMFINSLSILQKICKFILHYYSDASLFKDLQEKNKELQKRNQAGVSDMDLLEYFTLQHKSLYKDLQLNTSGSLFCANLKIPQGCETINQLKKVYYIQNELYFKQEKTGEFLKCNNLQFQGSLKNYIPYFYSRSLKNVKSDSYFDYSLLKWVPSK
ncbi:hypothetical protein [Neobacillus muris]|uniref:hypothetical protein n=1 Tax=Neobacillus muris TaxID=2941334 RepID=UPI00203EC089|nr:hypothetical protein [Neobacillus muris]